jgi:hypothetical protein
MSKPWHSKEWKEMRNRLIKDTCDQCGSMEKPMVLQHLWHPPDYSLISSFLFRSVRNSLIEEGKIVLPYRECCPSCSSLSIRSRETMKPKWVCIRCDNRFENPARKAVIDKNVNREVGKRYAKTIHNRTKKLQRDLHDMYMSGKGTITLCKKCAFLWDEKNMRLCQVCKEKYHKEGYKCCFSCKKKGLEPECYPVKWMPIDYPRISISPDSAKFVLD